MKVAGIEEAGRGPVVGPMIMAICVVDEDELGRLRKIGVKDSKKLSPRKRSRLVKKIKQICDVDLIIVTPKEIDDALNSQEMNLNLLEGVTTTRLINRKQPDKVIIDLPANDADRYEETIRSNLDDQDVEIVLEHKADENYPIVSAASIVAKTVRDSQVEKLEEQTGQTIGSGYPSDKRTITFLRENIDKYPDMFRKSWKTYKKIKAEKNQQGLDNY